MEEDSFPLLGEDDVELYPTTTRAHQKTLHDVISMYFTRFTWTFIHLGIIATYSVVLLMVILQTRPHTIQAGHQLPRQSIVSHWYGISAHTA